MEKLIDRFFIDNILNAVLKHGEVKVAGLGYFKIKKCKGRGKRIAPNGQEVVTRDYNKLAFRPILGVKRKIQIYGR